MNVKQYDDAVVIAGPSAGHVVKVLSFVPENTTYTFDGVDCRTTHPSWECVTQGSNLRVELRKNGKSYSPQRIIQRAQLPLRDDWLRPVSGLLDDAEAAYKARKKATK